MLYLCLFSWNCNSTICVSWPMGPCMLRSFVFWFNIENRNGTIFVFRFFKNTKGQKIHLNLSFLHSWVENGINSLNARFPRVGGKLNARFHWLVKQKWKWCRHHVINRIRVLRWGFSMASIGCLLQKYVPRICSYITVLVCSFAHRTFYLAVQSVWQSCLTHWTTRGECIYIIVKRRPVLILVEYAAVITLFRQYSFINNEYKLTSF